MVGWALRRALRRSGPPQNHAHGYPDELAEVVEKTEVGRRLSAPKTAPSRRPPGKDVSEAEGNRHRPHRTGVAARKTSGWARQLACPRSLPLTEDGVYLEGFGEPDRQNTAVQPETAEFVLAELQKNAALFSPPEKYPASLSAIAGRCKTELLYRPGRRVVHQHVVARGDHERSAATSSGFPRRRA